MQPSTLITKFDPQLCLNILTSSLEEEAERISQFSLETFQKLELEHPLVLTDREKGIYFSGLSQGLQQAKTLLSTAKERSDIKNIKLDLV